MRKPTIALGVALVIFAGASIVPEIASAGGRQRAGQVDGLLGPLPAAQVRVVNSTAEPVPTAAQGTTNVAGAVSVSNFPVTQSVNIAGAASPLSVQGSPRPPEKPVTLSVNPGIDLKPITLDPYLFLNAVDGKPALNGQLAISSITVGVRSIDAPLPVTVVISANDCAGNGYGNVTEFVVPGDWTEHLDYPTPNVTPATGPKSPFCLAVRVFNGETARVVHVTVVGYLV